MSLVYNRLKNCITKLDSILTSPQNHSFVDDTTWTAPRSGTVTVSGFGKGQEYDPSFLEVSTWVSPGNPLTNPSSGMFNAMACAVATNTTIEITQGQTYSVTVSETMAATLQGENQLAHVGKFEDFPSEYKAPFGNYPSFWRYDTQNKLRANSTVTLNSPDYPVSGTITFSDNFPAIKGSGLGGRPPNCTWDVIAKPDNQLWLKGFKKISEPLPACTGTLTISFPGGDPSGIVLNPDIYGE